MNAKHTKERAAIYVRVSTEEQREKQTIETQRQFADAYVRLNDLDVFDVYADDGVSGTVALAHRPEAARLVRDARDGKFSAVLLYRLDRSGVTPASSSTL